MNYKKSGFFIVIIWGLLTWLISWWIFSLITPKEIDLGESLSCPYATSEECLKNETLPRATEETQKTLVNSLIGTQKIASIFNFGLGILEFEEVIENRDSRVELVVSKPKTEKTILPDLEIVCNLGETKFNLEKGKRYRSGEYIQLYTFINQDSEKAEENLLNIARYVVTNYRGCDWVPPPIINFVPERGEIVVAPEGTISVKKVIRPFLIFRPVWLTNLIVYFGVFVLIGATFAILKQVIQIIKKGGKYFTE